MTEHKQEIMAQIVNLLSMLAEPEPPSEANCHSENSDAPIEMLTVKECTQLAKGLSERYIRQLAAQGVIPHIRVGNGKVKKILIAKPALLEYLHVLCTPNGESENIVEN